MLRFIRLVLCLLVLPITAQAATGILGEDVKTKAPDAALAASLFGTEGPLHVQRSDAGVPGWTVLKGSEVIGYIASTWEIAGSVGYSGRPLDVLVAISPEARIVGARLMQHNEPILTLGISTEDIARYVDGFKGLDLTAPRDVIITPMDNLPDVISRATVSTGVIRDGILRTARTLAIGRGLIQGGGGVDRLEYRPADWEELIAMGALSRHRASMDDAAEALAGAKVPVSGGDGAFLDLYAGLVDPPLVGRNLLGQQTFSRAVAALGPGETMLAVISSGLYSHRGAAWRRSGVFDRLSVQQGATRFVPTENDYIFVKKLEIEGAPEVKEISLFRLPIAIDPLKPFEVVVTASRPAASGDGDVTMRIATEYSLPDSLRLAPPPEPTPLWQEIWRNKRLETVVVAVMLGVLTLIFFAQGSITRRPKLWRYGRMAFLFSTLFILGWILNGQLSIVQVVAFVHSLLTGFRWETFLIEPVIFLLWSFTALGMLFWGRGAFCGWLCPFGALQELINIGAQKLGIRQIAVPQALHERLWVIKYTFFMAILALSFQSMHNALVLAEVEPFKTAISMRMLRPWPFVLYVLVILFCGLFVERFFCRYLCPLGAALSLPAKLKIFDWLHRRPQCGRECRLCETRCTVGAIDPLGRINPNECVLCLRCQVIMYDPETCPVLKRRARAAT